MLATASYWPFIKREYDNMILIFYGGIYDSYFIQSNAMAAKSPSNEYIYTCDQCSASFTVMEELTKHQSRDQESS